jgi:hypothetical protein
MIRKVGICLWCSVVALIAVCAVAPVEAQDQACDRSCLKDLAHQVLVSMAKHDASTLPLARWYILTENNRPSAPRMTALWRTITEFKEPAANQYIIDVPAGQVFVIVEVIEGNLPSLLWGRFKVENKKISELEIFLARAKSDSGLQFDPEGLSHLPAVWTTPVPEAQRATREQLTRIAQSVFNTKYGTPDIAKECEQVEEGALVVENPDALKVLAAGVPNELLTREVKNSKVKGGVSIPCGLAQDRPQDDRARILVDEEQGVAMAFAPVVGVEYSSFLTPGDETTFVPDAMKSEWLNLPAKMHDPNSSDLDPSKQSYVPVSRSWPAVLATTEIIKFYGNKIQGQLRLMEMQPVGSGSPWELK